MQNQTIEQLAKKFPQFDNPGTYQWFIDVFYSGFDLLCPVVDDISRPLIIELYQELKEEHALNWTRNSLHSLAGSTSDELLQILTDQIIVTTTRFEELKVALYVRRQMTKGFIDDYVVQKFEYYNRFLEQTLILESTGIEELDKINKMGRSEHSISDQMTGLFRLKAFKSICESSAIMTHDKRHYANLKSLEIDITTDCNLYCYNCDRMCAKAKSSEKMSVGQIYKFIGESMIMGMSWDSIVITGGEPTLHPNIFEIVQALLDYLKVSGLQTKLSIATNGYGENVQSVIRQLETMAPKRRELDTVQPFILNSKMRNQVSFHSTVNMAPMDLSKFADEDFSQGCIIPEWCGLGLNRNGFYCCGVAASIDRVFGFDIGIKSLRDVNETNLRKQMSNLCGLCGRYKDNFISLPLLGFVSLDFAIEEKTSITWSAAFEKYKSQKPELTLY